MVWCEVRCLPYFFFYYFYFFHTGWLPGFISARGACGVGECGVFSSCVLSCSAPYHRPRPRSAEELADPKLFANNVRKVMAKVKGWHAINGFCSRPAMAILVPALHAHVYCTWGLLALPRCRPGRSARQQAPAAVLEHWVGPAASGQPQHPPQSCQSAALPSSEPEVQEAQQEHDKDQD